jgi:ribosomal protein S19E (S16A)
VRQSEEQVSKFRLKIKPLVKIDEEMLLKELKRRYTEKGRDTLCKSTTLAKQLNGSPYVVRGLLPHLEEKGLVEKTELSRGPIVWRTRLGKK